MNKKIALAMLVSLMLSACAQQKKLVSSIPNCINNENMKETEILIKRFQKMIGPKVSWYDFDKVIPTRKEPFTGHAILGLKHKYHSTTFARVRNYRTNEIETTGRDPNKARDILSDAIELGGSIIKSKEREIKAIKDVECSFNDKYRTVKASKRLAFEIEVFKGLINVTIPNLIIQVNKGEEYQQLVYQRNNIKIQQKNIKIQQNKIARDRVKQRQASYLAEREAVYKDTRLVIQLIDYTNSTLFISIKNIHKNKIIETHFNKCTYIETKFGGTECVLVVNGLTLKDQYKNHFRLSPTRDIKIHPQEVSVFKFRAERVLDSSNLNFHIPAYSIGSAEDVDLKFPANIH